MTLDKDQGPQQLGPATEIRQILIQVLGPVNLRFSEDRWELTHSTQGVDEGFIISSGDGMKNFWWSGPFWAVAQANGCQIKFREMVVRE